MGIHFAIIGSRTLVTGVLPALLEFPAPMDCRLGRIYARISAVNDNGPVIFDVNVNGVSQFPSVHPQIDTSDTFMEVFPAIDLLEGQMVTIDVDSAPLGGVTGLYIIAQLQDAPTVEQYITEAYRGAFNRDPDAGELSDGVTDLTGGCNASTAIDATHVFMDSLFNDTEYTTLATTDEEYIEDLYNAVLGRLSDPAGFAYWVGRLGALTRDEVLENFIGCNEHVNLRIAPWCPQTLTRSDAIAIRGVNVQDVAPTAGDVLTYDGSDWAPSAPVGGLPTGGTTGQVLTKQSGTDGDADWEDPAGGGGSSYSRYDPDEPLGSPGPMDDEFEGSSLDAKWTVQNTGGGSLAPSVFNSPASWARFPLNIGEWVTYTQALASSGHAFECVAKVQLGARATGGVNFVGLVAHSYFGHVDWLEMAGFGLYAKADNSGVYLKGWKSNGSNTAINANVLEYAYPSAGPIYLRWTYATSSSTLKCYASTNGQVWEFVGDIGTSDGSPVGHIGFAVRDAGGGSGVIQNAIDFFRVS